MGIFKDRISLFWCYYSDACQDILDYNKLMGLYFSQFEI